MADRIAVRHSELRDFRECPLKHRIKWSEGWRSPRRNDDAQIGTMWHSILEAHYSAPDEDRPGAGWDEFNFLAAGGHANDEQVSKLSWMYKGYLEAYGDDPDWDVLMVERELEVPLYTDAGRRSRFVYQFHADLVVREKSTGNILVVDHKSTGTFQSQENIDLDDQYGLYVAALNRLRRLDKKALPAGIIVPVVSQTRREKLKREMVLEERYRRIPSYRTTHEQQNILIDALETVRAIHAPANRKYSYSSPNPRQCSWKCEYLDVHLQVRKDKRGMAVLPSALRSRGFVQENGDTDSTLPGLH